MRELGVQVQVRKKQEMDDLLRNDWSYSPKSSRTLFYGYQANQKWVIKIKDEDKVYLSLILDLFNNEVISYTLSYSPNWALVEKMLKLAVKRLDKTSGSILHSD